MSDKHPTRTQIIGGVVSGLVVAAILRLTPAAWAATKAILGAIGGALNVSVPLGTLIVTGLLVWLVARWRRRPRLSRVVAEVETESAPDELGEIILNMLAARDGADVSLQGLSDELRIPKLRLEHSLELLDRLGLITYYGTMGSLTASGRGYAIKKGYVPLA